MTGSDEWERLLLAERDRLSAVLADLERTEGDGDGSTGDRELSSADQHPADDATETQTREQAIAEREATAAALHEVQDALGKLREGTFGTCEACGRPIGDERLRARPGARLCIDDERLAEAEAARPR